MFQVANYLDLEDYQPIEDPVDEEDDDPQCVCGVYRSEHSLCGCPEGFQTPAAWGRERDAIRDSVFSHAYGEDSHLDDYGSYDEYY